MNRARLVAVAATVMAAGALLWPVLGAPTTLAFGSPAGEGPAHLWGLWTAAEGLFQHGPFLRVDDVNHPAGFRADLVDPVSLLVFWPIAALGGQGPSAATLAWNALHLVTIALAGWGGWRLGRRLALGPWSSVVLVAALAAAPGLQGGATLGRTEYLALAWVGLHLSFLHELLDAEPSRRARFGALVTLLGLLHSGWHLAALVLGVDLLFVLIVAGLRAPLSRFAGLAALAAILALPGWLVSAGSDPWWLVRLHEVSPLSRVPPGLPLAELLRGFAPRHWEASEVVPYPGLALVGLGLLGVLVRPRTVLPWLSVGVLLWFISLGPTGTLDLQSGQVRLWLPMALVAHLLPPVRAPDPARLAAVRAVLGTPAHDGADFVVWPLAPGGSVPPRCKDLPAG